MSLAEGRRRRGQGTRGQLLSRQMQWALYCAVPLIVLLANQDSGDAEAAGQISPSGQESGRLEGVYEPSGVQQLEDGRFVVVGDEAARPFTLLSFVAPGRVITRPLLAESPSANRVRLDDLEAIALGKAGYLYAITSHSRKGSGHRDAAREKLVRFKVVGDRLVTLAAIGGLRQQIVAKLETLGASAADYPARRLSGLSIEGLAFDSAGNRLILGLRSPLIDGKALLLTIADPEKPFDGEHSSAELAAEHWLLDLDGGGVRALAYDSRLEGYLILSRREKGEGKRRFKLWLWTGDGEDSPRRLRFAPSKDLERAEGITPAKIGDTERILIVRDDGRVRGAKAAHYLLLSYPSLAVPVGN